MPSHNVYTHGNLPLLPRHRKKFDRIFARLVKALEKERIVNDEYIQAEPNEEDGVLVQLAEIASGDASISIQVRLKRPKV